MKTFLNIAFSFCWMVTFTSNAQLQTHSFEQIDSLQQNDSRNTVVFIYTDWCKFCHAMQATTLVDENNVELLNSYFCFVALNAEEQQTIVYKGHPFQFKPTGNLTGMHELAEELATIDGKVSFPSLCILNQKDEIIFQSNYFLSSEELETILSQVLKSQE